MPTKQSPIAELIHQAAPHQPLDRRTFLRGLALAGALAGCAAPAAEPQAQPQSAIPTPQPRLRAAFAHNGLKTIWNQRGRDTARMLGRLLGIDVVSYDGELSIDKQRRDLEEIAGQTWNFVVIHPLAVNAYIDPVRQIVAHGIPVDVVAQKLDTVTNTLGQRYYRVIRLLP